MNKYNCKYIPNKILTQLYISANRIIIFIVIKDINKITIKQNY